ncbi:iron-siderophore ABC transporter substrate-binding protein [Nocardioides sp.]|uniref:iron-siderophore ABC transporter substrate-binding protein n=1 Tax=Nocardioides sp. TaxID=35761 RepID=UPI0039E72580
MLAPRSLRVILAGALTALALAGCGSSESEEASESADSTVSASSGDSAADAAFPVTIEHAFGETTIEKLPERVATVAWANHEVPLSLGIVPVGMTKVTWGDDDDNGVLPWVEDKLTELGADTPALFDETDGIPFEQVADTKPDVILAAYSGLTQEDYDTLSKIAPVIAQPGVAWGTSMDDMIRMDSEALGLTTEGEELVASLEEKIDATIAKYPALSGKKILFTYLDPKDLSQVGFYTLHDTRPGFLAEHGFPMPAIVEEKSAETEEFYTTVSAENAEAFDDVDVFVTYGNPDGSSIVEAAQSDPLLSKIPAVAKGAIAVLPDSTPLSASANPSPLSIDWALDDYLALIDAAASKSQ